MTIPQLFSYVGWPVFSVCALALALHTINLLIPGVDFFLPSSRMPIWPYVIGLPLMLLGLVIGVIGFFSEKIHEAWIDRLDNRR